MLWRTFFPLVSLHYFCYLFLCIFSNIYFAYSYQHIIYGFSFIRVHIVSVCTLHFFILNYISEKKNKENCNANNNINRIWQIFNHIKFDSKTLFVVVFLLFLAYFWWLIIRFVSYGFNNFCCCWLFFFCHGKWNDLVYFMHSLMELTIVN